MPFVVAAAAVLLLAFPYASALMSPGELPVLIGEPHPDPLVMEDSDTYEGCWHFWWTARAISLGIDPRHCPLIYPPEGASLAYQHIGWIDTYIFALSGLGGSNPVLSYNLSLFTGTLLTALFGWLLARSWGLSPAAAILTALMIAWLPARTARVVQHYQLADCWTLTASLWLCRSWIKHGTFGRYAGYVALTAAASIQSPFLGLFALLGIPITAWISRGPWSRAVALSGGALAGAAVGFLMVATAPGDSGSPAVDPGEAVYWAAEPQSFLLPSPFGIPALLSGIPHRLSWMSNTSEGVVGPGLTVLILLLLAARRFGRWRPVAAAAVLFLLCLGPELRFLGRPLGIPLPFRLLQHLPFIEGIRAPSRFALLGGMVAAVGAGSMLSSLRRGWRWTASVLLLLELFVPTLPVLPASIPSEVLGLGPGTTVLEVPVEVNARRYSLFQTAGGYSRVYGFLARSQEGAEVPDLEEALLSADVVVYHRWLMLPGALQGADSAVAGIFGGMDLSGRQVWVARRNGRDGG
jgi:hypothetical protein